MDHDNYNEDSSRGRLERVGFSPFSDFLKCSTDWGCVTVRGTTVKVFVFNEEGEDDRWSLTLPNERAAAYMAIMAANKSGVLGFYFLHEMGFVEI